MLRLGGAYLEDAAGEDGEGTVDMRRVLARMSFVEFPGAC